MLVYINEDKKEFDNNREGLENLFQILERKSKEENWVVDSMEVDGLQIEGNFLDYLSENITSINTIYVKTIGLNNLVFNNLVSTMDYLENSIPIIKSLSDKFYQSPEKSDWDNIIDLIEGIGWVMESFSFIDGNNNMLKYIEKREDWNRYTGKVYELIEPLNEIKVGMENQDNILIGDILAYEIIEIFKEMSEMLMEILRVED